MAENKIKTRNMIIAIFCTLLAILCIVFYFLPAFNIKHSQDMIADIESINYSAWQVTIAAFTKSKVWGSSWEGLMHIKDTYGFAIIIAGVLTPLGILCSISTAVFAYMSWLKGETYKKYCFLFSLCGMIFQTVSLVLIWFVAMVTKDGNNYNFFYNNIKGGMSYASFVSLILAFVIAIIACAYNYFLDDGTEEYDDDDEDDEDDDEDEFPKKRRVRYVEINEDGEEEEVIIVRRKKVAPKEDMQEELLENKKPTLKTSARTNTSTTTAKSSANKKSN